MRLLAAGQRPVSNVVDVSNYVMLELGKPIHTFDAAAVHDGRIVVRLARDRASASRRSTTSTASSTPDTLLIADPEGRSASPGVMGGGDLGDLGRRRRDVVVESAIFDPVSIRRTAFRYALRSEASLRFEKGQEHRLARLGADRTARLISEWAGGAGRRRCASTRTRASPAPPGRLPAGARQPAARHGRCRPRSSATCWRGSGSRPSLPRAGSRDPRRDRAAAARASTRATPRRCVATSRPGGATS